MVVDQRSFSCIDWGQVAQSALTDGLMGGLGKIRKAGRMASVAGKIGKTHADDVIHVTPNGVALPPGRKIPEHLVENEDRLGSYGTKVNGRYTEVLRIDHATPPGAKGPNYSYYHKNNGGKYSIAQGQETKIRGLNDGK